jgi:hypothetical protein
MALSKASFKHLREIKNFTQVINMFEISFSVSASNNPKIKICLTLLELLKETPIPVPATTQASA